MWGIEKAKNFLELQKTISNAIKRLISRVDEVESKIGTTPSSPSAEPAIVPIGTILAWTSGTSLPIGYLECLGQEVSRTTYSQLFNVIGTTFGVGDGSTTFNLPNGQGLVLRGEGTQNVNGRTKDGGSLGDVLEDQMQKITGEVTGGRDAAGASTFIDMAGAFTRKGAITNGIGTSSAVTARAYNFDSANSPDARTSSTTDGETRASSLSVIWIIRAQNLETATATESAVDALNARVTDVESQLPPPITAITGLGDFFKVGRDTRNSDSAYTISFDTPFTAGTDADIFVVTNREVAGAGTAMFAYNVTKSGFSIDRDNAIDGDQTVAYIAINRAYL